MTHLAAIGVGVLIALLFVGLSGRKSKKEEPAAAVVHAPPPTAAAKKKRKKPKKKKAKAASPAAAAPAAEEAPEEQAPALLEEESAEEEAAPAPPTTTGGGKKKKKKKKGGGGGGATTTATSNGTAPPAGGAPPAPVPAPAPAEEVVPAPAPVRAASPPPTRSAAPMDDDGDGWETIPKKGKKKKNAGGAAKKPRAAAAAPSAPVETSVTVTIDASRVGVIIGPKGATMLAIQEKTGTKLDVRAPKPDENGNNGGGAKRGNKGKAAPTAAVVITEGSPEGRRAARQAVADLAARGYAALLQAEGFGESSVEVHPRCLSEIVGVAGKVIKAIQTGLDVKLTIPKTDWTPKTMQIGNVQPSVRVGIAGDSPANVRKAKQVIRDICSYHHHPVTHPGLVHKEIYVPHEFFHCVIGTRGSEIKHIRGNYRVDVHMPSDESWCVTENVICVGKAKDVDKAVSYIELLMDRASEARESKYSDEAYGDDSGW